MSIYNCLCMYVWVRALGSVFCIMKAAWNIAGLNYLRTNSCLRWHAWDSSGGVTGEASTWPRCVHLLPRWQVTQRGPTVAIGNGRTSEWCLFGATWRTVGEHLVPRGYWHLLALVDWHIKQHIINFIISPGIISLGSSILFYPLVASGQY